MDRGVQRMVNEIDIKSTLKKIITYLNNKLIKGDYIFISCGEHTAQVSIDGMQFNVWIANGPTSCGLYVSAVSSVFGHLDDEDLSDEQRIEISRLLMPKVIKYREDVLIREKEKELANLKQQITLRSLCNE